MQPCLERLSKRCRAGLCIKKTTNMRKVAIFTHPDTLILHYRDHPVQPISQLKPNSMNVSTLQGKPHRGLLLAGLLLAVTILPATADRWGGGIFGSHLD